MHSVSIVCYSAFAAAYLALSWVGTPHVIDSYPDSHTYLPISFLGHAQRLWTVPVIYFVGGSPAGRVALQSIIGVACWIALGEQVGRVIRTRVIRLVAQILILLLALTAPVLQWNRAILSESIAISLTVLLLATSLALARRLDTPAVVAFLLVVLFWAFTRQDEAIVVFALLVPFATLALVQRKRARRMAFVALLGVALIGAWGTTTALQTTKMPLQGSKVSSQAQLAGIVQWRAATNPGEMTFLWNHGLPHTRAITFPPPFTATGEPVNVNQFGNPFAEYRIAADPAFRRWASKSGEMVLIKYLITHPWSTVSQPLINAPQLMTMNPDYIATPALPEWASTIVYGNLSSLVVPNAPSGPPRSSDPIYLVVLVTIAVLLFIVGAFRRQLSRASWVAALALAFGAIWALVVWNLAAGDLPREFVAPAVLVHLALIVFIASALDSLVINVPTQSTKTATDLDPLRHSPSGSRGTDDLSQQGSHRP
jgi:hypothetical protein